ncbi:MAG: sugar ABC transporter ATP-binding protein [Synergistaceae bacterium]|nr:sugar ABC transporter ATP-binding protein [Synergistaceae bacterium]MBQ9595858.1 sugar ABC transporter ATP-binding protein [Synergistaceae bacterium]
MSDYVVTMEHITKTFPGVKALDDVHLHLKAGRVMALLGENGAGKSTLMKILSGVYTRDSGEITIFGNKIEGDLNTKQAQALGVAIIHQELNMCQHLSVAANMFLGREITKGGRLDNAEMNKQAVEQLAKLGIHDIDPDEAVGNLTVGRQQMVEIAKALLINAKVLVMDEPSSSLSNAEITEMFRIVRELKAMGTAIVYISHRLQELHHIVDDVTIMRDGKYILEGTFDELTGGNPDHMDKIIANMVGHEVTNQFPREDVPKGKKILEVKHLNAGKLVRDVSFEVYEGEVLGFSGLVGAGRTETMRAIFGADVKDSGEILLDGKPLNIYSPGSAIRQGIVLAPEDRKKEGLCTKLSIRDNIALPNLDIITLGSPTGRINKKTENEMIEKGKSSLTIKMAHAEVEAGSLSGGNQQKVVVAKWLARQSRVIIFDEPTRGIDVAAKVEIYEIINELKKQGVGVVIVSSELPEVMGISDRIIVMCNGKITGEVDPRNTTEEEIMTYATRFGDNAA